MDRNILEDELDSLNLIISAAEKWAKTYSKDPDSHAKILKVEGKMNRAVRKYLRELANDRVWQYINWGAYRTEMIKAYDVKLIFDDSDFSDGEGDMLVNVMHDPLLDGMGAGISAGQTIYDRDIGLTSSSAEVLKAARTYSAKLVKGVNDTTRDRIQQSLHTSLTLGEDQSAAASRISDLIDDPYRAEMIARTEAVNSYTQGLLTFADQSGAGSKVWQALDATDECADLDGEEVGIDEEFSGEGGDGPPLHPNCRCGVQLIYPMPDGSQQTDEEVGDG